MTIKEFLKKIKTHKGLSGGKEYWGAEMELQVNKNKFFIVGGGETETEALLEAYESYLILKEYIEKEKRKNEQK